MGVSLECLRSKREVSVFGVNEERYGKGGGRDNRGSIG